MEPYRKQYKDYTDKFMKTRTDSYFATQFLNMSKGNMTYEDVKAIWESYSPDVQKYGVCAQDIKSELEVLAKVRPGKPAPDFTAKDINGKPFTLSSLKGKVVIIDFWASWCVPCRKSNPHMRELYNKYHAAGLEIYQVSVDPDEHFWKTSTAAIPWICVRDEDGIQGKSLTLYNVQSIPTFFLIDRTNTLQARDAQIKDIEAAIKNLL